MKLHWAMCVVAPIQQSNTSGCVDVTGCGKAINGQVRRCQQQPSQTLLSLACAEPARPWKHRSLPDRTPKLNI